MNNETNRLAQIIATEADKYRAIRAGALPTGQDKAAAEAIEAEYLVIRKADLPAVTDSKQDPNTYYVDNENVVFTSEANARMWVMRDIAVWQHIAAKEDLLTQRRRDELAEEFAPMGAGSPYLNAYDTVSSPLRSAIDRIIELERNAA
jgi:hypothetical protein